MLVDEFLSLLKEIGNEQTAKIYRNHGAIGDVYGIKIGDMKKFITKHKLKKQHELGVKLFDTNVAEAKYAAKYIVDYQLITISDLEYFLSKSEWYMNVENSVPDIAAQTKFGFELATKWVNESDAKHLCAGYSLYSTNLSYHSNELFNLEEIERLLSRVEKTIHQQENRVRYCMNNFVIGVGAAIPELTTRAKEVATNIGKVEVYLGKTSCKVPDALPYIEKIEKMNRIGHKRKTIC